MRITSGCRLAGWLALACIAPSGAYGEERNISPGTDANGPATQAATPSVSVEGKQPNPKPLTSAQLECFADLVGDTPAGVEKRLALDPALAALAAQAADARMQHQREGRQNAIAGFTVLGVGDIVGGVLMLSGVQAGFMCSSRDNCGKGDHLFLAGAVIAGASTLVGLIYGISGVAEAKRETELETQASERYGRPVNAAISAPGLLSAPTTSRLVVGIPVLAWRY